MREHRPLPGTAPTADMASLRSRPNPKTSPHYASVALTMLHTESYSYIINKDHSARNTVVVDVCPRSVSYKEGCHEAGPPIRAEHRD